MFTAVASTEVRAISSSHQLVRMKRARASLDIRHEIELGFDGICIADAHLVPMAISAFKENTKGRSWIRRDVGHCHITSRDLFSPSFGSITMMALRENIESALEYLEAWLAGQGSDAFGKRNQEHGFGRVVPSSAVAVDSPFRSSYVRAASQPLCGRMPHP